MSRFTTIVSAVLALALYAIGFPAASVLALVIGLGVELVALKHAMDEQRAAQALRPVRIARRMRDPRDNRR